MFDRALDGLGCMFYRGLKAFRAACKTAQPSEMLKLINTSTDSHLPSAWYCVKTWTTEIGL